MTDIETISRAIDPAAWSDDWLPTRDGATPAAPAAALDEAATRVVTALAFGSDGFALAALHLRTKADVMRHHNLAGPSPIADMMARIFEAEAEEILALRHRQAAAG